MESRPAECLYQKDSDKYSDAVNSYILYGWSAACHKGLMIFIQSGKSHTEDSGQKHQPYSPDTIDIQGKGNRNGKKKIFCHMGAFPYIILDAIGFTAKLMIRFSFVQNLIFDFYDLIADLVA